MLNKILIVIFLICITFFIFSKFINSYNYNKQLKFIKGEYFSRESLCSGFLNDVLYDTNSDSCQLPCYIYNTFQLISSQKFIDCGRLSHSITIDGDIIKAKSDITINQHKVVNKHHYKNQQSLKV